jgi:hypothetical protein
MARAKSRFLVVIVAGGFLAATLGTVSAHEFVDDSPLTIKKNHKNPYEKHEVVVFKGKIKTDRKFCKKFRLVKLIKGQNHEVDRDITGARGRYKVTRTLRSVGVKRFHTRVTSKIGGQHPHRHVCLADSSKVKKIVVVQQS